MKCRSVSTQIDEIEKVCPKFNKVAYARWPQFVAQLRHAILHKMGKVDQEFRTHMGFVAPQPKKGISQNPGGVCLPYRLAVGKPKKITPLNLRPWEARDQEKVTGIWPDEATWDTNYKLDADVCLDIEKVITPSLVLCARYAEEVRKYFIMKCSPAPETMRN
jgi:hypothetical protein